MLLIRKLRRLYYNQYYLKKSVINEESIATSSNHKRNTLNTQIFSERKVTIPIYKSSLLLLRNTSTNLFNDSLEY